MARIPLRDENDPTLSPEARELLLETGTMHGHIYNVNRALVNHPRVHRPFWDLIGAVFRQNSLTRRETELAWLTVSVLNRCHY